MVFGVSDTPCLGGNVILLSYFGLHFDASKVVTW